MRQRFGTIGDGFYHVEPMSLPVGGYRWRAAKRVPKAVRAVRAQFKGPIEIWYDTRTKQAELIPFWERSS